MNNSCKISILLIVFIMLGSSYAVMNPKRKSNNNFSNND